MKEIIKRQVEDLLQQRYELVLDLKELNYSDPNAATKENSLNMAISNIDMQVQNSLAMLSTYVQPE